MAKTLKLRPLQKKSVSVVKARPRRVETEEEDEPAEVAAKPVKRTKADKAKAVAAVKKTNTAKRPVKDVAEQAMDDAKRRRRVSSAALLSVLAEERKLSGDFNVATLEEAVRMCVGIPVPFVFEYLIGASFFPLGRVIAIVGKTGANKSALAFEIAKWFKTVDGSGILFDVEDKYNAALAKSIVGTAPSMLETCMGMLKCSSCTDWQKKLQRTTIRYEYQMYGWKAKDEKVPKDLKAMGKRFKPTGDGYPLFAIVDSVVAKLTEKAQEGVEERGFGDKKFADEALSITYFLKTFTKRVASMPMSLILINHLKLQKAEGSYVMERKKGGGTLIDFQETLELEMQKVSGKEYNSSDRSAAMVRSVNQLRLVCKKNSYGATGREILITMSWLNRKNPDTGLMEQVTQWDWAGALVDLLLTYKDVGLKKRIAEIVDINCLKEGKSYCSKKLKVPKEKPVSKRELGKLISSNPKMKQQLRELFGICEYAIFEPGIGYRKQIDKLRKSAFSKANAELDDE